MSIFLPGFLGAAGVIAAMTAAFERGDVEEASRQGILAGPAAVEQALGSRSRPTVLAAVSAVPRVESGAELLPALASVATQGDRRVAIPAATSARAIARELAVHAREGASPDDLDLDDVATWRALWGSIASHRDRFIEVRVRALETVAALGTVTGDPIGFDLAGALGDPDPAYRRIALDLVPRPTPPTTYAALAHTVTTDRDDEVARAAAGVLCGDDRDGARAALGADGLARVTALVDKMPLRTVRDARRCTGR